MSLSIAGRAIKRYLVKGKSNTDYVENLYLYFKSKMVVTEQYWVYGFMAYVAENGGFVGLFLGYSVLQLHDMIGYFLAAPSIVK